MKNGLYIFCVIIALSSCKDNNVNVFDKTADQRVTDALASLKADLIAPANGFKIKYKPENASGSFYMLLKFNDDNSLIIRSDAASNNGQFVMDTITYRIDSSLGLQLVFQNYSFFSFLFEQNNASFPAEYQFTYVNKTPDGSLVFKSKTDPSNPTIVTFEKASTADIGLLGVSLAKNLELQTQELSPKITSSLQLIYQNRDLIFYISIDQLTRVIHFNSSGSKSNTQNFQTVNFSTGYVIKGDSMVFDSPLSGNFSGNAVSFKSIEFNKFVADALNVCAAPTPIHIYSAVTSSNDIVKLTPSLIDVTGEGFKSGTFYDAPLNNILMNGKSAAATIAQDITGAQDMQLYYNYDTGGGTPLYAIGFRIINKDGSTTFALRQFTPVLSDNNIVFTFASTISIFGNKTTDANTNNIDIYLNALTQGDQTYVFKYADLVYEFYNPCSAFNVVFVNSN